MGLKLYLKDDSNNKIEFSYTQWDDIKLKILKMLINYIEILLISNTTNKKNVIFNEDLKNIINLFYEEPQVHYFLSYITTEEIDALIYFNLYGAYIFLDKGVCDTYYSIGNSYDMINTFTLILAKEDPDITLIMEKLIKLFTISIEQKKIIVIY